MKVSKLPASSLNPRDIYIQRNSQRNRRVARETKEVYQVKEPSALRLRGTVAVA